MKSIIDSNFSRYSNYLFFVFYALLLLFPDFAFARTTNPNVIATVVCNIVEQLTGPIGQAVSSVAVIFIGIGLFMGKISWGLALGIAIGMALLFGAENVVGWIAGGTVTCTAGAVI